MTDGKRLWNMGEWYFRALQEKRIAASKKTYARLTNHYRIQDYEVREKGDHYASYNLFTGEIFLEAESYDEAWRDLKEAFMEEAV